VISQLPHEVRQEPGRRRSDIDASGQIEQARHR